MTDDPDDPDDGAQVTPTPTAEPAKPRHPVAEVWEREPEPEPVPVPGWLPPGYHLNLLGHRRRDDQPDRPI